MLQNVTVWEGGIPRAVGESGIPGGARESDIPGGVRESGIPREEGRGAYIPLGGTRVAYSPAQALLASVVGSARPCTAVLYTADVTTMVPVRCLSRQFYRVLRRTYCPFMVSGKSRFLFL